LTTIVSRREGVEDAGWDIQDGEKGETEAAKHA
jgi:hypothetical protein